MDFMGAQGCFDDKLNPNPQFYADLNQSVNFE
jgi:hypothetical protein